MAIALLTAWLLFIITIVLFGGVQLWKDWETFRRPPEPSVRTDAKPGHQAAAFIIQYMLMVVFFPLVFLYRVVESPGGRLIAIGWAVLITGLATLVVGWPFMVVGESSPLRLWFSGKNGLVWASLSAVPLAALLHLIKQHQRFVYGLFEYVIGASGFALGVVALATSPQASLSATLSTAAGSYLMVEGIENIKVGWPQLRELSNLMREN